MKTKKHVRGLISALAVTVASVSFVGCASNGTKPTEDQVSMEKAEANYTRHEGRVERNLRP